MEKNKLPTFRPKKSLLKSLKDFNEQIKKFIKNEDV